MRHGGEWLALWSDPESLQTEAERAQKRAGAKAEALLRQRLSAAGRSLSGSAGFQPAEAEWPDTPDEGEPDRQTVAAARGQIDSMALVQRFHDPLIHQRLSPDDPDRNRLFQLCETVRCEALGGRMFPGVAENLVAQHLSRLKRADLLNAHLASLVQLAEALRMVLRDTLLGRAEPSIDTAGFRMWDGWIRQRLTPQLEALAAVGSDQEAYGRAALALIDALFDELEGSGGGPRRPGANTRPGDPEEGDGDQDEAAQRLESPEGDIIEPGETLFAEDDAESLPELLQALQTETPPPYRVFTTAHDRVVAAETLEDAAVLRERRVKLDAKRAEFRREFARLVAQLQRRLMARQTRSWAFDLEEGLIDASRLDRVVVNPGFADAYKQEEESLFRDTAVTLLLDNSGSMRGPSIEIACIVSDMIAAALERCDVTTEILGFTTSAWKGGKSAQDWIRAGRPENPGRLNDLLHIVYKSAGQALRRSRNNICAMLSPSLLKENVDGEALLWAAGRLLQRPEARKLLIVVSDGAPVDRSTLEANADKRILDRHLRRVIGDLEGSGQIEVAAIGVKHNVSDYYRSAIHIEKIDELGAALVGMLSTLLLD